MVKKIFYSSRAWCILFAVLLLGSMLLNIYPLQSMEYKAYDIMARLRQQQAGKPVVIVAIDDKSIKNIGGWPWPRSVIAQMVWRLSGYRTHTLGINLLYPTTEVNAGLEEIQKIRDSLPKKLLRAKRKPLNGTLKALSNAEKRLNLDSQLRFAVQRARNVVLPLRFVIDPAESEPTSKASEWLRMNSVDLLRRHDNRKGSGKPSERPTGNFNNTLITASSVFQPFTELSTKASGMGHINLIPDDDNVVRKIPLIIRYQERDFLSFALLVSGKYFFDMRRQDFNKDLKPSESGLQLRHLQIPTDNDYQMYIDYGNQKENIRKYSFSDVLNGNIPGKAFQNKIVLIGVTAGGLSPYYKTTFHSNLSEIEIVASAIENLINHRYISRPPWSIVMEVLVLLYFLFFLVLVIPKVNLRIGVLILGIFLITWVGTTGLLFLKYGFWLQVTAPILLAIVGFGLARHNRLSSEKQKEQIELNKSLGLSLQSQGMLDTAFEKFLNCPIEDNSVKQLLYNLGLDFERKRMFNKALVVYRRILKAGRFKDIQERIKNLKQIEKAVVLPAGFASKNEGLVLDSTTTKPTLGRYEIIKELGHGAMGTVYLGKDPSINREVAIKTLNYAAIEAGELKEVKSQFFREAEAAGKLSHPNIVTIYDVGEDHDMAYFAMELIKGKNLTSYCQKGNLLSSKRILHVITSVAQALDYAHNQGVVHRDIKPANIMLQDDDQVKVADFGIARVMSSSSNTQTGVIFGTPNYMSPEQVAGKKVDGRSDLFSLGVVFYELLSGKKPFQGENITSLTYAIANTTHVSLAENAPKVPECCSQIVDKLLTKGVSRRFKAAAQVIKQLQECQNQLT
jgi:serine/threonine-protein kinase